MKFFMAILTGLSCFGLSAMQTPEEIELAALVSALTKSFAQYSEHRERNESEFRIAAMQLFLNSEKEKQLKKNNPIKKLYQESDERIINRMIELCVDISEDRQQQIIASVPLYFNNQRCLSCNKRKVGERDNKIVASISFNRRCFNCKKHKKDN